MRNDVSWLMVSEVSMDGGLACCFGPKVKQNVMMAGVWWGKTAHPVVTGGKKDRRRDLGQDIGPKNKLQ
jgi:hypothetical protein